MESISYLILPLTFIAFSNIYKTKSTAEYKKYLEANKENHHYDGITLDAWFNNQIT